MNYLDYKNNKKLNSYIIKNIYMVKYNKLDIYDEHIINFEKMVDNIEYINEEDLYNNLANNIYQYIESSILEILVQPLLGSKLFSH